MRGSSWVIKQATTDSELQTIQDLFRAYAVWLEVDLWFQDFEKELRTLPGDYAPPRGSLRLALVDGRAAGCVAVREIEPGVGEIKRLYVVPEYRDRGIGEALMLTAINDARVRGLRTLRLDTISKMDAAKRLYARLGFRPIVPYYYNPIPGAVYLELDLNS